MYSAVLLAHSWIRWIALIAAVGTILAALRIRVPADRAGADRWSLFAMAALDLQMLLGLILYIVLSPVTKSAFVDMAAAMREAPIRFFAVEHPVGMIVAIALAHVGRVRVRKASDSESKHKRALVFFGLALLVLLLSIPWPIGPGARSLFRGL